MTADLNQNILNLKPSVPPLPQNKPYKLTFLVKDEIDATDLPESHRSINNVNNINNNNPYTNYYDDDDDVVVESYENSNTEGVDKFSDYASNVQHNSCIVSAFLYFITISTFAYLVVLWIKQKMHMQMELMHWW